MFERLLKIIVGAAATKQMKLKKGISAKKPDEHSEAHLISGSARAGVCQRLVKQMGRLVWAGLLLMVFYSSAAKSAEVEVKAPLESAADVQVVTPERGSGFRTGLGRTRPNRACGGP